jgi:hypothetical protein
MKIGALMNRLSIFSFAIFSFVMLLLCDAGAAFAGVGDPQVRSDHPWYPGELSCSTFARLQATQAELYRRVVGVEPRSDHERVLAAWLWRNTHYWHGEEGAEDLWGRGFTQGGDSTTREYWTGLFAHGYSLCGTTHSQWVAEMEALLGHNRGRSVGTAGHNSFEVWLTGGAYGEGKWALLDHDISTVIFNKDGKSLLSIAEVSRDFQRLTRRDFEPQKQCGWLVCGLHPDDGGVYARYDVAQYLSGYSGPPPIVHLRRGETLRRYPEPGLEDGKTFVFWGRNYGTGGIPGPERAHTWVNQPDKMFGSKVGAGYKPGQARFANAVYTYRPDFTTGDYREGVTAEDDRQVTFEFYSPYIIAATPANDRPWGIYEPGCRNGLVVTGTGGIHVSLSVDQGTTWADGGRLDGQRDLTDIAKGHRQYLIRFDRGAKELADSGLSIMTVCQANSSIIPRLTDGGTDVKFAASGRGIISAGPNLPQARAHVTAGAFDTPSVTLELTPPRQTPTVALHAAAHVLSSSPPSPEVEYSIDVSTDGGRTWRPVVKDWRITRRGDEPADFWSQSFCWGTHEFGDAVTVPILARFRNTGGKRYARAELHLAYALPTNDSTEVTFNWTDDRGRHQASRQFSAQDSDQAGMWQIATGQKTWTHWVEYRPVRASEAPSR